MEVIRLRMQSAANDLDATAPAFRELAQSHDTTRGYVVTPTITPTVTPTPHPLDRAASPRILEPGGAAQGYTGYFYSHNVTESPILDADRLRFVAEFENQTSIPGAGTNRFSVIGMKVERVLKPIFVATPVRTPIPTPPGETTDTDGDGLGDYEERYAMGRLTNYGSSNPDLTDSDADGLWDGLEVGVTTGTSHIDSHPSTTTNPAKKDTDGDGYWDGPDVALSDGLRMQIGEDIDGDGQHESGNGETDPNNVLDYPARNKIQFLTPVPPSDPYVTVEGASINVSWTSDVSTYQLIGYNVYRSTSPTTGFTKLNTTLITNLTFADTTFSSATPVYYFVQSVNASMAVSAASRVVAANLPGYAIASHGAHGGEDDDTEDHRAQHFRNWDSASTGDQFIERLKTFTTTHQVISKLVVFSHGNGNGLLMTNNSGLYYPFLWKLQPTTDAATLDDLEVQVHLGNIAFGSNCTIIFQACLVGLEYYPFYGDGFPSFAEQFASTIAPQGTIFAPSGLCFPAKVGANGRAIHEPIPNDGSVPETGWFGSDQGPWRVWYYGNEVFEPWEYYSDIMTTPNSFGTNELKIW